MQFNEQHMKTIIMFNQAYHRARWHKKKRVRKKNYARAQYMLRKGLLQMPRKEWEKYFPKKHTIKKN